MSVHILLARVVQSLGTETRRGIHTVQADDFSHGDDCKQGLIQQKGVSVEMLLCCTWRVSWGSSRQAWTLSGDVCCRRKYDALNIKRALVLTLGSKWLARLWLQTSARSKDDFTCIFDTCSSNVGKTRTVTVRCCKKYDVEGPE